jgi:hypothetical protein
MTACLEAGKSSCQAASESTLSLTSGQATRLGLLCEGVRGELENQAREDAAEVEGVQSAAAEAAKKLAGEPGGEDGRRGWSTVQGQGEAEFALTSFFCFSLAFLNSASTLPSTAFSSAFSKGTAETRQAVDKEVAGQLAKLADPSGMPPLRNLGELKANLSLLSITIRFCFKRAETLPFSAR